MDAKLVACGFRDVYGQTGDELSFAECVDIFTGPEGYRMDFAIEAEGRKFHFWIWRDETGKDFRLEISGITFEPQVEIQPACSQEELLAIVQEFFPNSSVCTPQGVVEIRDGEIQA